MDTGRGRAKGVVKGAGNKGGGQRMFYASVGALLVAGIATLSFMSTRSGASQIDSTIKPIPNTGHSIGSDSALVEVVEFGDFECPACGSFANLTEPDIRARLVATGQIRFRFVDFPLNIHRNTWPAHLASWCAGEQGRFWEMHDALFMNQDRWSEPATRRPERVISELARGVGVGMEQYDACMDTQKYRPQIQANVEEGIRLGVGSTPTFIFGQTRVGAVLNYDQFKRYADSLIADAKAKRGTKTRTR